MTMPSAPKGASGVLLPTVLDELGVDIVSGTLPAGHTFTLQQLSERFGISRTVAREVMRALEQMGMVSSSRRVGIKVLPESSWDIFDLVVMKWRWRVDSHRERMMAELDELRCAIEPFAATTAAQRRTDEQAERLTKLATDLAELLERQDAEDLHDEIIEANRLFRRALFEASGNKMIGALAATVCSTHDCLPNGDSIFSPEGDSFPQAHIELARAVEQRDVAAAAAASRVICQATGQAAPAHNQD
ncbi:FadR/GntR family transcriptional regulator [Corynebacterium mayonis]|uniref:FadR/GntR family transcriptional regulator n=1 Tax=Corynebacterium mayonis TaxID=3062461 RepID=UPI00314035A8